MDSSGPVLTEGMFVIQSQSPQQCAVHMDTAQRMPFVLKVLVSVDEVTKQKNFAAWILTSALVQMVFVMLVLCV